MFVWSEVCWVFFHLYIYIYICSLSASWCQGSGGMALTFKNFIKAHKQLEGGLDMGLEPWRESGEALSSAATERLLIKRSHTLE